MDLSRGAPNETLMSGDQNRFREGWRSHTKDLTTIGNENRGEGGT